MRVRRLRNEQRLKQDKVEMLMSKDLAWQEERRKQEQIKVSLWSILDLILTVFACPCTRVYFIRAIPKIEGTPFCKLNYYETELSTFTELNLLFSLGKQTSGQENQGL